VIELKEKLLVIVGPTAVGKTEVSMEISKRLNIEIVSADSMQVYKYMDIGTAKPTSVERSQIPHHMIDIIDPDEEFSVADYQIQAKRAIKDILGRGNIPLITGGTGLYINALCYDYIFSSHGRDNELRNCLRERAQKYGNEFLHRQLKVLDPKSAKRIHPNNVKRVIRAIEVSLKTGKPFSSYEQSHRKPVRAYSWEMLGLTRPRHELYSRIDERASHMMSLGLEKEVKSLLEMGYSKNLNSLQGLGYRQIIDLIEGKVTKEKALELICRDTRRYAKRQYTWFSRDDNFKWIDISAKDNTVIADRICHLFKRNN